MGGKNETNIRSLEDHVINICCCYYYSVCYFPIYQSLSL